MEIAEEKNTNKKARGRPSHSSTTRKSWSTSTPILPKPPTQPGKIVLCLPMTSNVNDSIKISELGQRILPALSSQPNPLSAIHMSSRNGVIPITRVAASSKSNQIQAQVSHKPKADTSQNPCKNKDTHRAYERKRKFLISDWIIKIGGLLYQASNTKQNKLAILQCAYDYISRKKEKKSCLSGNYEIAELEKKVCALEHCVAILLQVLKAHALPIPEPVAMATCFSSNFTTINQTKQSNVSGGPACANEIHAGPASLQNSKYNQGSNTELTYIDMNNVSYRDSSEKSSSSLSSSFNSHANVPATDAIPLLLTCPSSMPLKLTNNSSSARSLTNRITFPISLSCSQEQSKAKIKKIKMEHSARGVEKVENPQYPVSTPGSVPTQSAKYHAVSVFMTRGSELSAVTNENTNTVAILHSYIDNTMNRMAQSSTNDVDITYSTHHSANKSFDTIVVSTSDYLSKSANNTPAYETVPSVLSLSSAAVHAHKPDITTERDHSITEEELLPDIDIADYSDFCMEHIKSTPLAQDSAGMSRENYNSSQLFNIISESQKENSVQLKGVGFSTTSNTIPAIFNKATDFSSSLMSSAPAVKASFQHTLGQLKFQQSQLHTSLNTNSNIPTVLSSKEILCETKENKSSKVLVTESKLKRWKSVLETAHRNNIVLTSFYLGDRKTKSKSKVHKRRRNKLKKKTNNYSKIILNSVSNHRTPKCDSNSAILFERVGENTDSKETNNAKKEKDGDICSEAYSNVEFTKGILDASSGQEFQSQTLVLNCSQYSESLKEITLPCYVTTPSTINNSLHMSSKKNTNVNTSDHAYRQKIANTTTSNQAIGQNSQSRNDIHSCKTEQLNMKSAEKRCDGKLLFPGVSFPIDTEVANGNRDGLDKTKVLPTKSYCPVENENQVRLKHNKVVTSTDKSNVSGKCCKSLKRTMTDRTVANKWLLPNDKNQIQNDCLLQKKDSLSHVVGSVSSGKINYNSALNTKTLNQPAAAVKESKNKELFNDDASEKAAVQYKNHTKNNRGRRYSQAVLARIHNLRNPPNMFSAESLSKSASAKKEYSASGNVNFACHDQFSSAQFSTIENDLKCSTFEQSTKASHSNMLNCAVPSPLNGSLPTIMNIFAPASLPDVTTHRINNNMYDNFSTSADLKINTSTMHTAFSNFSAEALVANSSLQPEHMQSNGDDGQVSELAHSLPGQLDLQAGLPNEFTNFSADTLIAQQDPGVAYAIDSLISRTNTNQSQAFWNPGWLNQTINFVPTFFPGIMGQIPQSQEELAAENIQSVPVKDIDTAITISPEARLLRGQDNVLNIKPGISHQPMTNKSNVPDKKLRDHANFRDPFNSMSTIDACQSFPSEKPVQLKESNPIRQIVHPALLGTSQEQLFNLNSRNDLNAHRSQFGRWPMLQTWPRFPTPDSHSQQKQMQILSSGAFPANYMHANRHSHQHPCQPNGNFQQTPAILSLDSNDGGCDSTTSDKSGPSYGGYLLVNSGKQ